MNSKEAGQTYTNEAGKKVLWWAEIGGIVAALLGGIAHSARLVGEGLAVVVGAKVADKVLYGRKKSGSSA